MLQGAVECAARCKRAVWCSLASFGDTRKALSSYSSNSTRPNSTRPVAAAAKQSGFTESVGLTGMSAFFALRSFRSAHQARPCVA